MLKRSLSRLSVLIVIGILLVAYAPEMKMTWFVVGSFAGVILRQVGISFQSARLLPVFFRIIDWRKLAELLADDTAINNTSRPVEVT